MLYNNHSLKVKYIFKPVPVVSVLSLVSRQLRFVAVLSKFQQVTYNANNILVEKFGDKRSNTFVNHCTSIQVDTVHTENPCYLEIEFSWNRKNSFFIVLLYRWYQRIILSFYLSFFQISPFSFCLQRITWKQEFFDNSFCCSNPV